MMGLPAATQGLFPVPQLEYQNLAPVLIVLVAALLGVLVEAFLPRTARFRAQLVVTFGGLLIALAALFFAGNTDGVIAEGAIAWDGPARFLQGLILVLSFVAFLLFTDRKIDPG
ncbi:MAG: NADH-quinone oxidoreductase subunit N, partial [Actinobacteria bacterium]|nr:NADH-quinone oxidoreductase subunit N [Actinomycetota bacterium]